MATSFLQKFAAFTFFLFFYSSLLNAQCNASFDYSIDGFTVTFTDTSVSQPDDPIVSWSWNFGNGSTSVQQNPVHVFNDIEDFLVTLTITTQNGCSSTVTLTVDLEQCQLDVSLEWGTCDASGNVPITIMVYDVFDNARDVFISIDGISIPGSPFEIDQQNPVSVLSSLAGDGLEHNVVVSSSDIPGCITTVPFVIPGCNSDCFLSGFLISYSGGMEHTVVVGQGGGTSFFPQQLTITLGDIVNFVWEDDGHSTTSDAVSGPDSWNSGVVGFGSQFSVTLQNPGIHPYYCIPHGAPGGVGMSGTIIANCPNNNMFSINISFSTTQVGPGGYNVFIDGLSLPGAPFSYSGVGIQLRHLMLPGDGQNHLIEIIDVDDPTCFLSANWNAPDCGATPVCSLGITAMEVTGCNLENEVGVEIALVSVNGGNLGFNVYVDGNALPGNPFNYADGGLTNLMLSITGDGLNHTIMVQDVENNTCSAETTLITTDCFLPCAITNLTATTGNSLTQVVYVEDFQFSPSSISITAGDIVEWQWTGNIQHTSTSDAVAGPDSWNSGLFGNGGVFQSPVLSAGIHPYYCIPHGGPGGQGMSGTISVVPDCNEGMVAVNLNFENSGTGGNGFNVLADDLLVGNYSYGATGSNTVTVMVPGDGQIHSFEIQEVDDLFCNALTQLVTPDCNISTCQLSGGVTEDGVCVGDFVTAELTLEDVGGSAAGFEILLDGSLVGNFSYSGNGTTIVTLPVPGDAQLHNISIFDLADSSCSLMVTITTSDCQAPCSMSGLNLSVLGTQGPLTHIIQVTDFEFVPQHLTVNVGDTVIWQWTGVIGHTTTSDAESGPDSWSSGVLGQNDSFQVVITAEGFHPYYCIPHGGPGGQGMSGSITAVLPSPPCNTSGEVMLEAAFLSMGTGAGGFEVFLDGTSIGQYPYSGQNLSQASFLVPGDGQQHLISLTDVELPECTVSGTINVPLCNATGLCALALIVELVGECDENNQVNLQVTVTGDNAGSGFDLYVDGIQFAGGPFEYAVFPVIPLDGNGGLHIISAADTDSLGCEAIFEIEVPLCSTDCSLELSYDQVSGCNDMNELEYVLHILSANTDSLGINVFFDDELYPGSPFAYNGGQTDILIVVPGDGGLHQILVADEGNTFCRDTLWIEVENCEEGCLLNGLQISYQSPALHEIEVKDFEFFPKNIVIDLGDTVRWLWTGVIAHTTTSDATSGADAWNSGLFSQGAVFEMDITSLGYHPYYCIPHGAPGGIGMAGSVTTIDPCEDQILNVSFDFIVENTGLNGYVVLLDGLEGNGSPFAFTGDGINHFNLLVEGDGMQHIITIADFDDPACFLDTLFIMPDCSDPCWAFNASFSYELDLLEKQVSVVSTVEGGVSWLWDFGDATTAEIENAVHTYSQAGDYEICLTVLNAEGCESTYCEWVVFGDIFCLAAFDYSQQGFDLVFSDVSATSDTIQNWAWSVNGNVLSQEQNFGFAYTAPGFYEVCLTINTAQCGNENCTVLDLTDPCLPISASFSYTINETTSSVQFFDETAGTPDSWLWGFGTGATSNQQNPVYNYENPGNYTVCLLVQDTQNGCLSSICDTVNYLTTGLGRMETDDEIIVYPNPAQSGNRTWRLKGLSQEDYGRKLELELLGLQGQKLIKTGILGATSFSFEVPESLLSGMYLVVIKTDKKIYRTKIMVL